MRRRRSTAWTRLRSLATHLDRGAPRAPARAVSCEQGVRAKCCGCTEAFQASRAGSIPVARFKPRGVAQSGSAPGWGPGGRRFKSCLPDSPNDPLLQVFLLIGCVAKSSHGVHLGSNFLYDVGGEPGSAAAADRLLRWRSSGPPAATTHRNRRMSSLWSGQPSARAASPVHRVRHRPGGRARRAPLPPRLRNGGAYRTPSSGESAAARTRSTAFGRSSRPAPTDTSYRALAVFRDRSIHTELPKRSSPDRHIR